MALNDCMGAVSRAAIIRALHITRARTGGARISCEPLPPGAFASSTMHALDACAMSFVALDPDSRSITRIAANEHDHRLRYFTAM